MKAAPKPPPKKHAPRKKAAPKKAAAKKAASKKPSTKKVPAKKVTKKAQAKKATTKKALPKKKTAPKKVVKAPTKKAPVRKTTKKVTPKKPTPKKVVKKTAKKANPNAVPTRAKGKVIILNLSVEDAVKNLKVQPPPKLEARPPEGLLSVDVYGHWCGPGHGFGEPIDAVDTVCMRHDKCYDARGYFDCMCDNTLVTELTEVLAKAPLDFNARLNGARVRDFYKYIMVCKTHFKGGASGEWK
jgi:hypothetical protein